MIKEHCLQGLFECLSNLCCWNEVDNLIQEKLNHDISNIWDDPWKDWMFPWLFEVDVHKLVKGNDDNALLDNLQALLSWLHDDVKEKYIKRFFGTEVSMFSIESGELENARDFLLNSLDEIREQWVKIHPLSTQLRFEKLQKLRIINDVNEYIGIFKVTKQLRDDRFEIAINRILKLCSKGVPSAQDAILPWYKLTSYRTYFITLLNSRWEESATETQSDSEGIPNREEVTSKLHTAVFKMRLKMIDRGIIKSKK